jgi:hypothetical protein
MQDQESWARYVLQAVTPYVPQDKVAAITTALVNAGDNFSKPRNRRVFQYNQQTGQMEAVVDPQGQPLLVDESTFEKLQPELFKATGMKQAKVWNPGKQGVGANGKPVYGGTEVQWVPESLFESTMADYEKEKPRPRLDPFSRTARPMSLYEYDYLNDAYKKGWDEAKAKADLKQDAANLQKTSLEMQKTRADIAKTQAETPTNADYAYFEGPRGQTLRITSTDYYAKVKGDSEKGNEAMLEAARRYGNGTAKNGDEIVLSMVKKPKLGGSLLKDTGEMIEVPYTWQNYMNDTYFTNPRYKLHGSAILFLAHRAMNRAANDVATGKYYPDQLTALAMRYVQRDVAALEQRRWKNDPSVKKGK